MCLEDSTLFQHTHMEETTIRLSNTINGRGKYNQRGSTYNYINTKYNFKQILEHSYMIHVQHEYYFTTIYAVTS